MSFILNPYRYAGFVNANSLSFDGTNEFLTISHDSSIDFNYNEAYSISMWINADNLSATTILLQKRDVSLTRGYEIILFNTGEVRFSIYNSSTLKIVKLSNTTLSATTWYNIVVTYDGSNLASGTKIYINNSLDSSVTQSDTLSTNTTNNTTDLIIGQYNSANYFDGYIDEVSIWDKELSSGEVSDIYNSGCPADLNSHSAYANLVSWWRMGEGDTISSITDQIDKKYLSFDGTNEYVDCGNDSSLSFNYNSAFSISGWCYFDVLSTQLIFTKQASSSLFQGYSIRLDSSGNIQFNCTGNTGVSQARIDTNTAPISTSTWYNIIVTKSTSSNVSGMTIYINGSSVATTTINNTLGTTSITNSEAFHISSRQDVAAPTDGYIDEVSVWNKELSSTEVTALYDEGRYNPKYEDLSFYSDAVSYWRMGEDDTISSITDLVGSNDGTPTNMDSSNLIDANNTGTPQNMDSSNITTETPC